MCHTRVGSGPAAEDLAQETLLRGLRALPTLREPARFGPWICGIAQRTCLDWLKARERKQVSSATLDAMPARSVAECESENLEMLMAEVEALPDPCREAIMLYYYQDMTYQELAELLGVSAATVNARLTKARAILRRRLASQEVDP